MIRTVTSYSYSALLYPTGLGSTQSVLNPCGSQPNSTQCHYNCTVAIPILLCLKHVWVIVRPRSSPNPHLQQSHMPPYPIPHLSHLISSRLKAHCNPMSGLQGHYCACPSSGSDRLLFAPTFKEQTLIGYSNIYPHLVLLTLSHFPAPILMRNRHLLGVKIEEYQSESSED